VVLGALVAVCTIRPPTPAPVVPLPSATETTTAGPTYPTATPTVTNTPYPTDTPTTTPSPRVVPPIDHAATATPSPTRTPMPTWTVTSMPTMTVVTGPTWPAVLPRAGGEAP
jgi:hypothetical protein